METLFSGAFKLVLVIIEKTKSLEGMLYAVFGNQAYTLFIVL